MSRTASFATVLTLVAGLPWTTARAQTTVRSFELAGSATLLDAECIRLTPDVPYRTGSAWHRRPIDLTRPFQMDLSIVLGRKDAEGADGIVFVFHATMRTGYRGEGMGFAGLEPSIGVEFDTYRNVHLGDPAEDHVAVLRDGRSWHDDAPPAVLDNLEDGARHALQITWNPTRGLAVHLDGKVRTTQPAAAVLDVFGGEPVVYWGMTAATGRLSNAQDVCIERMKLNTAVPSRSDTRLAAHLR